MSLGPDVEADPYLGLQLANALRLNAVIGVGTTGRVYRAIQLGFERMVAVKVLHRFLMQTKGAKERFHREARLMARLVHPGIVRVLDSGELPPSNDSLGGETYVVYEYLEGQTLRARLLRPEQMGITEAVNTVLSLADAIGCAHERQIIHRDLKPENVMSVARDNGETRYVVLDFGLARALDSDTDPLTRAGAILGTPQYMSPEAARGEPASPESDVYALAIILYELLAGHPPFHEGSPIAILAHQAGSAPSPFAPGLNVPKVVEDFVMVNLNKDREHRCSNATEFACTLLKTAIASHLTPRLETSAYSPSRLVTLNATLTKSPHSA